MSPTENDLRSLLLQEASDVGPVPTLERLPHRRPYLPVAATVLTVLVATTVGVALARHSFNASLHQAGTQPTVTLGANPKAGIGPAGTTCIRGATSMTPLDPSTLPPGTKHYRAAAGEPITITTTSPNPLGRTVTSIRMSATGPGTPTGDCALAVTSTIVSKGHPTGGMPVSYTFTPWEPGSYAIGLQGEPETAGATKGTINPKPTNSVVVVGTLVGVVDVP